MEYHSIDRSIPKSFLLKYKVIENKYFDKIEIYSKMIKLCLLLCCKSKGCITKLQIVLLIRELLFYKKKEMLLVSCLLKFSNRFICCNSTFFIKIPVCLSSSCSGHTLLKTVKNFLT